MRLHAGQGAQQYHLATITFRKTNQADPTKAAAYQLNNLKNVRDQPKNAFEAVNRWVAYYERTTQLPISEDSVMFPAISTQGGEGKLRVRESL
jgi:hypothetical protein